MPDQDIDLGEVDYADPTPGGPAAVELFDPTAITDIDLGGMDYASPAPGVNVELVPPTWQDDTDYAAGATVIFCVGSDCTIYETGAGGHSSGTSPIDDSGVVWVIVNEFLPITRAALYDRDGVWLSDLDNGFALEWQDPLNDVGSGSISIPLDDADSALFEAGVEVRCYLYEELVYAFEVEQDPSITRIDEGEEHDQIVKADGRGRASLMARARVFPAKGLLNALVPQHRLWSFASPDFPNLDGWGTAVNLIRAGDIDAVRFDIIEYTTVSSTILPDAVDYVHGAAPLGFPDPDAYWIWGQLDSTVVGFNYFRGQFTLATTLEVHIAATGDNLWTLYLDGVPLLGDDAKLEGWKEYKIVDLTLVAGTYYLAAVVENVFVETIVVPENNPAALLCSVYTTDENGDQNGVIYHSDDSWSAIAYPALTPGWTPGQIVLNAVAEAQARGLLAGFSGDFTATTDSHGNPWVGVEGAGSYVPMFSVPVGGSVLDVLDGLVEEGWIDYRVKPGGKIIQMFNQNTPFDSGIALVQTSNTDTQNIVSARYEPQAAPTNMMLVKWPSGYFELSDPTAITDWGAFEGYLVIDAQDEADARRQAQIILDELKNPKVSMVFDMDPHFTWNGADDRPYLTFAPGDYLTVPNKLGSPGLYRLHSISVTQDDMGRPRFVLECDCRLFENEREREKLMKALGRGVTGDTKIRNAMDKTTGVTHA